MISVSRSAIRASSRTTNMVQFIPAEELELESRSGPAVVEIGSKTGGSGYGLRQPASKLSGWFNSSESSAPVAFDLSDWCCL